ncbi:hypothetical protein [Variovorax boronicumulans]
MKINYRNVAQILPAAYVLLYFFRFLFDEAVASIFAVILGMLGVLSAFIFFRIQNKKKSETALGFLILMLAIGLFNAGLSKNDVAISLFQSLTYSCAALSFFCVKLNLRLYKSLLLILAGYFLLQMMIGTNPNEMFLISQNYVSIIFILSLCVYYVACDQNGKKPEIYPALIGIAICIWAGGRSGILSVAMLALATMFFFGKINRTWLVVALLFCVSIYVAILNIDVLGDFYGLERLARLGLVDVRDEINAAYLQRISTSFHELIFGAPLNEIPEVSVLGGNPHNSYIRLHTQYGAVGFVLLLGILGCGLFRAVIGGAYIFAAIVFVSMLRVSSDIAAFHGPLDLILYYGIFATLFGVGLGERKYKLFNG